MLTRYVNNPRARTVEELTAMAEEVNGQLPFNLRPILRQADNPLAAWKLVNGQSNGLICITGSFFLAAELRDVVIGRNSEFGIRK